MNEQVSTTRLGRLIWADLIVRARPVALISMVLAALMLINGIGAGAASNTQSNIFSFWFWLMLFGWGPIASSLSFRELHDKHRSSAYLLMPASAFEKTLSRLLIVTLIFLAYAIALTALVSWLTVAINQLLFGYNGVNLQFLTGNASIVIAVFLVTQSLYFVGAAWFRRLHFIKTASVLTFGPIAIALFVGLVFRLSFPELANLAGGPDPDFDIDFDAFMAAYDRLFDSIRYLGIALFFFVLPVFCWFVAWLRVKETQVSDGV